MAKTVAALVGGVLLGIAGTWIVVAPEPGPDPVDELVRDIDIVPRMTPEIAEAHREERFADLNTIADVFALPDSFMRAEALHTVAGRSSAAEVQNLIFEANRIADDYEREQALNALFFRLTSLDPRSALALAQSEYFEQVRSVEQTVWRAWGRTDLDEALFAAKEQTSRTRQNLAAQALYAAYGMLGNEYTDRIESELGIEPNRSTRARYVYRLSDTSIEDAIAFINELDTVAAQHDNISWLAYYLSLQDTAMAITYAELFEDPSNQERYRNAVQSHVARENPQQTIDRLLASGQDMSRSNEFFSAVRQLVATDLDAAKAYYDNYTNPQYKSWFGSLIAQQMVRDDPDAALAWARENEDGSRHSRLEQSVLQLIARTDPQRAFDEALAIEHAERRSRTLINLVTDVAGNDPMIAASYVDQITDPQQRRMALIQFAQHWVRTDPDAAIDWALTQDSDVSTEIINNAGMTLMMSNLDSAIRLLPRLDENSQRQWRTQIAQQLASYRSVDEAQSFIRQFENQPGYEQLQTSLISGLLERDVLMAKQLADQLSDTSARDSAYMQIVSRRANTDPGEAMAWLVNISDEGLRSAASARVASSWYQRDPQAAQSWVSNLPGGATRDDAIVQMSHQWRNASDEQVNLINSIGDRDKRGQAKIRRIYRLVRTDPDLARDLLQDEDIPDYLRQQAEVYVSQYRRRW